MTDQNYNPWAAAIVLLLGNFMNLIDVTIVNVALPSIRADLGATPAQVEWVAAGYVLAFAAGLLPFGRFGDMLGRKRLFLWGIGLFTLASALCGLAQSMPTLIAARALQGFGASMMVPQVMALIHVMFEPDAKAKALSLSAVMISVGAVSGPMLGGALIGADLWGLGWRPIFLVNLPVGLGAILFGMRLIPEIRSDVAMTIDWPGVVLFSLTITLIVLPVIEGTQLNWPWWCIAMLTGALPMAWLFIHRQIRLERAGRTQLLPMRLMRSTSYMSGLLMVMLHFSAIPGMFLVLAIYLQTGFGLTPLQSGMTTAPFPLVLMLGSTVTGRFGQRGLVRRIAVGTACLFCAMLYLRHVASDPPQPFTALVFVAPLALGGFGAGLLIPPMFQLVLNSVPGNDAGAGAGTMQTFQQTGTAIGIAMTSSLFFAFLKLPQNVGDYPGAMQQGLLYPLAAFSGVLIVLSLRSHLLRKAGAFEGA